MVGGSSSEPVLSRVAGPKVLLQHPEWRSGDQSQRTGSVTSTVGVAARHRPSFEPWWSGWLLIPSYGERLGGGAVCPLRRGVASSEAEIGRLLEGRSATLERGGDWLPARG